MIDGDLLAGAITTNKPDEFDADDSRFFVAHLPGGEKILLVNSPAAEPGYVTFIEKAIRASSQSRAAVKQVEINGSIPDRSGALARYSVVVAPIDALAGGGVSAAREYVRNGGSLIVTFGADTRSAAGRLDDLSGTRLQVSFDTIAETESLGLTPPVMANDESDGESSIDAQGFASARFRAAHSIRADGGEALLRYSNGLPAVMRIRVGAGQILIPGFGLSDSSLSRGPAFPVIIEWLISLSSAEKRAMQFVIGQAPAAGLLPGLTRLTRLYSVNGPRQEELAITQSALTEPGVYEAEYQSGKKVFALNSPRAESTPGQATDSELLGRVEIDKTPAGGGRDIKATNGIGLWRVLAIGALIMSLIEMAYKRATRPAPGAHSGPRPG